MNRSNLHSLPYFNPLPDDKILDWSILKQSADDNFEFDVNSRKFSKLVENTVGKGEIARYEQFLLCPQCFKWLVSQRRQKVLLCGNEFNTISHGITTSFTQSKILLHLDSERFLRITIRF